MLRVSEYRGVVKLGFPRRDEHECLTVDLTTGVVPLVQTMCLASWVVGQWLCSSGTNEDRRQGHRKKAGAREHDDFEK